MVEIDKLKKGVKFTVISRPSVWSEGTRLWARYPLNLPFPYKGEIDFIEDRVDFIHIRDTDSFGWSYNKYTENCFKFEFINENKEELEYSIWD